MKKIVSLFLAGTFFIAPSFAVFSDVDESHWAYSAISKMEDAEILSGYEDGSFKPSNNITLAEFAVIFSKIFQIPQDNVSNYFTDIPVGHWAKGYVETVREYINPLYDSIGEALGVTEYAYLTGLPGDIEMTREAFIYAVSKIYGYSEELYTEGEEKILFADADEILYPKEVVMAYKNKIISGEVIDGMTYIKPQRCITRAEASAIFRKLLKYEENRVTNKNEESQLNAVFSDIVRSLKNEGLSDAKGYIYDTLGVLSNENFGLSDSENENISKLTDIIMTNFEYEVLDRGFYSFNRGYVKVKIKSYDIPVAILGLDIENIELEKEVLSFIKDIENKKIKKVEREETFNFAKKDGEWKLILK